MTQHPTLHTERLVLRRMELTDLPNLVKYASNKKVSDKVFGYPYPYLEEDAIARMNTVLEGFKNKNRFIFAITQKGEEELIGEIGMRLETEHSKAEIGYWIAEPYWGKGIASEAVSAILKFGFEELKINKLFATCFDGNDVSGKVLEKNGMVLEGVLKQEYFFKGEFRDSLQYRITRDEYMSS